MAETNRKSRTESVRKASPPPGPRKRLGEILVGTGACTQARLDECLALQKAEGGAQRIGEILVAKGYVSEEQVLEALSVQTGLPYLKTIDEEIVDKELLSRVPMSFARKHKMIPLYSDDGVVTVAVADPLNMQPIDDIGLLLRKDVEVMITQERNIVEAINRCYHQDSRAAARMVEEMVEDERERGDVYQIEEESEDLLDIADRAPIIKLINLLILQALKQRASDIHVESHEKQMAVRFRVDGILYPRLTPPRHYHAALASRIKVMAKLNVAERRLPQDGKIAIRVADRDVDIRVSVIPTIFGERIVLRLLDRSAIFRPLEDLGLAPDTFKTLLKIITLSHGIVLVTGPTGCGKTTTLYGALAKVDHEHLNVITIEDPVEYQLEGIGQIQVKPKIDLTFANGLRSILRQDPDIIMVGEIRDYETAEIATHASLTGHLVFSTLHTNDASGAITRLVDMGIEPYLVSSSVIALMAQRLVRVICPHCKEWVEPDEEMLREAGLTRERLPKGKVAQGRGCGKCLNTGFLGRLGIFELLMINNDVRSLILARTDSATIKQRAIQAGMRTLRGDGALKVAEGVTTLDEVMRVTQEDIF